MHSKRTSLFAVVAAVFMVSVNASESNDTHIVPQEHFAPDTNASYYSCPTCDAMWVPSENDNSDTQLETGRVQEAINRFVSGLHDNDVQHVMDQFCENATLWGTVSQAFRRGSDQIESYFDFFAKENNQIDGSCTNVVGLDTDNSLYTAHSSVQANGGCLRMSFTVWLSEEPGSTCIADLYSSQFPNDPELLIANDTANAMPWTPYTDDKFLPKPATAQGICDDCAPETVDGEISPSDLTEMKQVLGAWAGALVAADPAGVAATYCSDVPFLWATVSNMRRYDEGQIESYFDWFALSRDFADAAGPGIRSVCSRFTKMSMGDVWRDDRVLDLGGQCLRMSYTLVKEDGKMCIKSLSSSYFPEVPEGLVEADQLNGMPWSEATDTPKKYLRSQRD